MALLCGLKYQLIKLIILLSTLINLLVMKHLHEVHENNYVSNATFKAEDNKLFEFAVCVEVNEIDEGFLISASAAKLPKYLSRKHKKDVAEAMCISAKEITVSDACSYGLYAPLDSYIAANENELNKIMEDIDNKVEIYGMLCGFYFDKQANRIGNTGWDFLNGKIN